MESFKTKSRIITILTTCVIAILTYIASMNPDQLANQLGIYGSYASVIIVICASIINQVSEEKRVNTAEELIIQKNKEPTIKIEVDADEVLSEIEERQKETPTNNDDAVDELTDDQQ